MGFSAAPFVEAVLRSSLGVGVVCGDHAAGKSSELVDALRAAAAGKAAGAADMDVLVTSAHCTDRSMPYLDAVAALRSAKPLMVVIDDADRPSTELEAFMTALKACRGVLVRVVLLVTALERGWAWAVFLGAQATDDDDVPLWHMYGDDDVRPVEVVPKPEFGRSIAQQHNVVLTTLSAMVRQPTELGDVMIFTPSFHAGQNLCSYLQLFADVSARLEVVLVHTVVPPSPGPRPPRHRVLILTPTAEATLLHHPDMRARHVMDLGAEPGRRLTRGVSARRRARGGFREPGVCIQFYGEADLVDDDREVDAVVARCKAMHLLGAAFSRHLTEGGPSADRRFFDAVAGHLTPAGRLVAALDFEPEVAHLVQIGFANGLETWTALLAAILHVGATTRVGDAGRRLLSYIFTASLWSDRAVVRLYYRIMETLGAHGTTLGLPPHPRTLERCLVRAFARRLCYHMEGPHYLCPARNEVLMVNAASGASGASGAAAAPHVLALEREAYEFVALSLPVDELPAFSLSAFVVPCRDVVDSLVIKLAETARLFHHHGVHVDVAAAQGGLRVMTGAGHAESARAMVEAWLECFRRKVLGMPYEVSTEDEDVRLVVTGGGVVRDVLLKDDAATLKIDGVSNLSDLLRGFDDPVRVVKCDAGRAHTKTDGSLQLTFRTRRQCMDAAAIFDEAKVVHWVARARDGGGAHAPRTPPALKGRLNYILRLTWPLGTSTGEALVTCPVDLDVASLALPHTIRVMDGTGAGGEGAPPKMPKRPASACHRTKIVVLEVDPGLDEVDVAEALGVAEECVYVLRHVPLPANHEWPLVLTDAFERTRTMHPGTFCRVDKSLYHGRRLVHLSFANAGALQEMLAAHHDWLLPEFRCTLHVSIQYAAKDPVQQAVLREAGRTTDWSARVDTAPVVASLALLRRIQESIVAIEADLTPDVVYDTDLCSLTRSGAGGGAGGGAVVPPGFYVEHAPRSPVARVYGPTAGRVDVVRRLCDAASAAAAAASATTTTTDEEEDDDGRCTLCCDAVADVTMGACGHTYCRPCVCRYLNAACEAQQAIFQCPECPRLLPWSLVGDLAHPDLLMAWKTHKLRQLTLRAPTLAPTCPMGGCGALLKSRDPSKPFRCAACDVTWCVRCSAACGQPVEAHRGSCEMRQHRDERLRSNEELERAGHGIHFCPCCNTPIQRKEGCSHMHCPMPACGAHYCHGCLQQFSNLPNAPSAVGVVTEVREKDDCVVVRVEANTWDTLDRCPLPADETLHLQLRKLPPAAAAVGARLEISTYIYDHINACARPVHPMESRT